MPEVYWCEISSCLFNLIVKKLNALRYGMHRFAKVKRDTYPAYMIRSWFHDHSLGPLEFNCWTSVASAFHSWFAVEYSSCFISVINLDLYVRCFDSLLSRSPSRGPNNLQLCVYEPQQNLGRGCCSVKQAKAPPPTPSDLLLTVPKRCFCCGLF